MKIKIEMMVCINGNSPLTTKKFVGDFLKLKYLEKCRGNKSHCTSNKKLRKIFSIASKIPGIEQITIEGVEKKKLMVMGEGIDAVALLVILRKKMGFVHLVSIGAVEKKKMGFADFVSIGAVEKKKTGFDDIVSVGAVEKKKTGFADIVSVGAVEKKKTGFADVVSVGPVGEKKEEKSIALLVSIKCHCFNFGKLEISTLFDDFCFSGAQEY